MPDCLGDRSKSEAVLSKSRRTELCLAKLEDTIVKSSANPSLSEARMDIRFGFVSSKKILMAAWEVRFSPTN